MHAELVHVRKPQDHKAQHCDDNGADPLADTADTASIYGSRKPMSTPNENMKPMSTPNDPQHC